jgi:ribonuclease Z
MEPIKITFLGTAGAVPQKERNFASMHLTFQGNNLLFDCPEGTQRQLMLSEHSLMKIKYIFISHMHIDHFLGLFGWIATMTMNERREKLTIYSPRGGKEKIQKILKETINPCFEIDFKEIRKGIILSTPQFQISAFQLKHNIPCFGFSFKENNKIGEFDRKKAEKLKIPSGPLYSKLVAGKKIKLNGKTFYQKDVMDYSKKREGRKIVYVADTRPVKESENAAKNADILVHEATFTEQFKQNALDTLHSTAKEAAEIAKNSKVKKLVLFHFSARNVPKEEIINETKKIFKNTIIAKDFETIII